MLIGYNTNGFAHHRLCDAIEILAEIGYRAVAITLDHTILDPPDHRGVDRAIQLISNANRNFELRVTLETGARFILDPRRKHQPTLISFEECGRELRLKYLQAATEIAAAINADSVSLWSGAPDDRATETELFDRLTASLEILLQRTESTGVLFSFEPEPDMFVDSMTKFARLQNALPHPRLGLTLDIGHL
ncbi:MAG: TIM barrel protein, partial [Planctomycetota bacterium]